MDLFSFFPPENVTLYFFYYETNVNTNIRCLITYTKRVQRYISFQRYILFVVTKILMWLILFILMNKNKLYATIKCN